MVSLHNITAAGGIASAPYLEQAALNTAAMQDIIRPARQAASSGGAPNPLPALPPSPAPQEHEAAYAAAPSMFANCLALIAQIASQSRMQNAQQRAAVAASLISEMKAQAHTIREEALKQFVTSVAFSAAQAGFSIASMAGSFSALARMKGKAANFTQFESTVENAHATKWQAINALGGTFSSVGQGAVQFIGAEKDARLKEADAEIERRRCTMESMKSLEDSMLELLRKAISAQDAMQQNINQTRSKILG